jgi:hypothetical protein
MEGLRKNKKSVRIASLYDKNRTQDFQNMKYSTTIFSTI